MSKLPGFSYINLVIFSLIDLFLAVFNRAFCLESLWALFSLLDSNFRAFPASFAKYVFLFCLHSHWLLKLAWSAPGLRHHYHWTLPSCQHPIFSFKMPPLRCLGLGWFLLLLPASAQQVRQLRSWALERWNLTTFDITRIKELNKTWYITNSKSYFRNS